MLPRPRRLRALVLSLLLCVVAQQAQGQLWSFGSTKKAQVEETTALDTLENIVSSCANAISSCLPLFKVGAATALLFHGSELKTTVLLLQALKISGFDGFRSAATELSSAYKRGRQTLKQELPTLLAAKAEVEVITSKLSKLKSDLKDQTKSLEIKINKLKLKKLDVAIFNSEKKKLISQVQEEKMKMAKQVDSLNESLRKVAASSSSLKTIAASVEPEQLKNAIINVWTSLLAIISAAKSKTVASVTMGLNFGAMLHDRIKQLIPQHILFKSSGGATWAGSMLQSAFSSLGVAASFFLSNAASTVTACSMGGEVLTNTIVESLESRVGVRLPNIVVTTLQAGIVALAAFKQLTSGGLSSGGSKGGSSSSGGAKASSPSGGAASGSPLRGKASGVLAALRLFEEVLTKKLASQ